MIGASKQTMEADKQNNSVPIDTQKKTKGVLKGTKRKWKDLSTDPLKDGYEEYQASVITGKTAVSWNSISPGGLFSRTSNGINLHCKIDASKAVSLDTGDDLEIAPKYRETLEVFKVISFNSTTVTKADF